MSQKLYERFHHKKPDKVQKLEFEVPKELVRLGVITAIEYNVTPPSKFAEGTYRHEFKVPKLLAADKNGVLYVIKAKITSRGIEG